MKRHTLNRRQRPLNSEINVVPYIDVMLVLLVIFIATAPMIQTGVQITLPKEETKPLSTPSLPVIISVQSDGSLFVSHKNAIDDPIDLQNLQNLLKQMHETNNNLQVMINADQDTTYADVMHLMAIIQDIGIFDIGLLSDADK